MRILFLSIDGNHAAALQQAAERVRAEHGVALSAVCYDAATLRDQAGWERLERDVAQASFIFGARLFGEEYVRRLEGLLAGAACPVLIITSNPALIRQTRVGKFSLARREEGSGGILGQWVKKLRPQGGAGEARRQLAVLRNLSKVLRLIPGKARDLYSYIVAHQYWLNSSPENLYRLLCLLGEGYGPGLKGKLPILEPLSYPETALFHPDAEAPFGSLEEYERWRRSREAGSRRDKETSRRGDRETERAGEGPTRSRGAGEAAPLLSALPKGTVGILTLRTVALSGNTAHLAALVRALEARGLEARMAYASGLDMRPAIAAFFAGEQGARGRGKGGEGPGGAARSTACASQPTIDLLINASGFALVGGPAEARPADSRATLAELDVPYLAPLPLSFQRVEDWRADWGGLAPIQAALSVAVPELEGAAEPMVFGGPTRAGAAFAACGPEVELIAERVARRVALRRSPNAEKRLALVIFNFPPNLGNIGTAAYLDVFASLYELLRALREDGYTLELPASPDELRRMVVEGNAVARGADANVAARLPVDDYRRLFPHEAEIEPHWGRAPGELLSDGRGSLILGRELGNVFVGVQPSFGYERDPMRLLMARDATPNHAFAAFYTWLRHVWRADAVVHVGTHGALEFMPGKQVGLSADCWPSRLLGGLPNFYYYSVNNPSEAAIAKRRSAATLVSYLVPPLQQAGLYKGLRQLKDAIDAYRQRPDPATLEDIRAQAERLGMGEERGEAETRRPGDAEISGGDMASPGHPASQTPSHPVTQAPSLLSSDADAYLARLGHELLRVEERMIPAGLHVIGRPPAAAELTDFLALAASFQALPGHGRTLPALVAAGLGYDHGALAAGLAGDLKAQERWRQVDAICREAMGQYVARSQDLARQGQHASEVALALAPDAALAAADLLARRAGVRPADLAGLWPFLQTLLSGLLANGEIGGLLHGLRGGFVAPSPSNDVVRDPAVLPTGRNVYSLDPYRVPSAAAMERGARLASELLAGLPEPPASVAVVLWGSDNLKSGCEGVAQVLALLGARPVVDELGSISSVELLPLAELGRPRIDVVVTVSGIFRDLLSNQIALIERAALLAATADEPPGQNFVRRHALAQAAELGIPLEQAAVRVFANAPGSYGANVNYLVESGTWEDEGQIGEAFLSRKSFARGADGAWRDSRALLERALATVQVSFQNVDSFEVGISDIDNYYDNLGGISKSVEALSGRRPAVLVADAMGSGPRVSTLEQAVRLESRAKLLNPKWYEAMLAHGYEGAREIEARVNNTYGWSATTKAVDGWVYQGVAETFVLDEAMRERLAALNPTAAAGVVRRLLEAGGRGLWDADEATLERLRAIYEDLEDRLEGIAVGSG